MCIEAVLDRKLKRRRQDKRRQREAPMQPTARGDIYDQEAGAIVDRKTGKYPEVPERKEDTFGCWRKKRGRTRGRLIRGWTGGAGGE